MAGLSVLAGVVLLTATGGVGLPFGVPPTPEDPAMSAAAPEECLFYLSWAGTASPDPNSRNQTEQMLAEPEVQNFLTQIGHCMRRAAEKSDDKATAEESNRDVFEALSIVATHPGSAFLSKIDLPPAGEKAGEANRKSASLDMATIVMNDGVHAGMVLSLGTDAPRLEALVKRFAARHYRHTSKTKKRAEAGKGETPAAMQSKVERDSPLGEFVVETVRIDNWNWYRLRLESLTNPCVTCGFGNGYCVVLVANRYHDDARELLDRMKGKPPRWLTALVQQAPVERRTLVARFDVRRFIDLVSSQMDPAERDKAKKAAEALGLVNVAGIAEVWGLDGDNFVNKTFFALDGQPQGLLRLISERPLKPEDLAAIPRDAASAAVFRLDLQQAIRIFLTTAKKAGGPDTAKSIQELREIVQKELDADALRGVLRGLGDTWCIYDSRSEGNMFTAVVSLRDPAAFNAAHARLIEQLKKQFPTPKKGDKAEKIAATFDLNNFKTRLEQFRFLGHDIYCLNVGAAAPCWCINDREVIFGISPQAVKARLSRGAGGESIASRPEIAHMLAGPNAPAAMFYWDPQVVFRFFYSCMSLYGPAMSNAMREQGMDVDLSLFPSLPSIDRHLGPTTATVRRTKDGIEVASRGTIPLPFDATVYVLYVAASAGSMMPVVIPAYTGEPARRTQELKFTDGDATPKAVSPLKPADRSQVPPMPPGGYPSTGLPEMTVPKRDKQQKVDGNRPSQSTPRTPPSPRKPRAEKRLATP
ncbi:MAG: hypothetical protein LLG00_16605 [Planctomycetaceae bacterium]|nr:hypothetical protein [Planctomycetaceae bacterium]